MPTSFQIKRRVRGPLVQVVLIALPLTVFVVSAMATTQPVYPIVRPNPSPMIAQEFEFATVASQDGLASYTSHYLVPSVNARLNPKSAHECRALRVPMDGVVAQPRDQGKLGLCFAYTAADLVSQRLGQPVSALDGAFRYFQSQGATDLKVLEGSGGTTAAVIVAAEKNGFCLEKGLPSDAFFDQLLENPVYRSSLQPDDLTYISAGFGWEVAPLYASGAEGLIKYMGEGREAAAAGDTAAMQKIAGDLVTVLPAFSVNEFMQLFQKNRSSGNFSLVNDVFNQACKMGGRVFPSKPIHSISYFSAGLDDPKFLRPSSVGGLNLIPIIDANLAKGRMVAVTYQVNHVVSDDEALKRLGFTGSDMMHASSIVARKFDEDSQQCEYQIRNSWGVQCMSYAEPFKSRCEKGYFWVTEAELATMVVETSFLE